MRYRMLGSTGMRASCLCLGTEDLTEEKFHLCRDVGINFFDCGNVYGDGKDEATLGRLIEGCRQEVIITSKVGFPTSSGINDGGLSRRHITLAVEESLKRLRTDFIDIYYVHSFDPDTEMSETLSALDRLVEQGKILYPAVSNWSAWQIAKALGISERGNLSRFQCIEPMYSLVKRQAEVEIFPLAIGEGMAVVPYSPLAGGLLSGKYSGGQMPKEGRLVEDEFSRVRYGDPQYYQVAERFTEHAAQRGVQPAALAIAWVMSHPAVTAPIIGAKTIVQLKTLLGALEIEMTPEWRAEISALSIEPPLATDRREEQFGVFYKGWRPR
jgi:aryl-alcohol dehydrogenase-like predicted oxidoreductase